MLGELESDEVTGLRDVLLRCARALVVSDTTSRSASS